jgi:hypothetical protein
LYACELSRQVNPEDAADLLEVHERAGDRIREQTAAERTMDEANSDVGLECAEGPRSCAEGCANALAGGNLFGPGGTQLPPPVANPDSR